MMVLLAAGRCLSRCAYSVTLRADNSTALGLETDPVFWQQLKMKIFGTLIRQGQLMSLKRAMMASVAILSSVVLSIRVFWKNNPVYPM